MRRGWLYRDWRVGQEIVELVRREREHEGDWVRMVNVRTADVSRR